MEVATVPQRVSSIPSPEEVNEEVSRGIIDLANQTFDRLAGRLALYAADERRDRGEGGTTLTADNENVLWENGVYGKVAVRIANRASRAAVWQAFQEREAWERTMRWPNTSHLSMIEEANRRREGGPDRYRSIAAMLLLHVLRDRYPRGDTDYRQPLMKPLHDYDKFPPEDWGERHKVGIELVTQYEDSLAPAHWTRWRHGIWLQSRFDKPEPQKVIRSRFSGLVDTFDIETQGFKPDEKKIERAGRSDVAHMTNLFELAKDIRPFVTPIEQQLRERAAFSAMINEFFGSSRGESSAPVE